ncbi:MAG: YidC/Oxa1 family insertase periplasmic-domain containing protein [Opitutales bacterium]|jgi:YidC/Oxa1 family membrane protein insertase|nr:YidC/Oxa1 family insertase periplasmic-domain containing protein [Opitutales bacterium]MDP4658317.1 YidC/Oxa1 family insertase periplasmic-domain containing protein [Opitutales bacterium]MDP4775984.1 YidC/Oxa1 family insertase periplasmic-domain containing protein [Opitutales bacterium]MDP4786825.1 YidC/Oxa1 family insertase periplasmic-domain containing protein [Opitutales bacterium]MDP4860577.1 YidC/Oxa1 family insertase periplasmic-domain containing protein [Opitutales bacterium]
MDRKNFFLGMACIVGAFALFFLTKPATPPPGATPAPAPATAVAPAAPSLVAKPAATLPVSAQSARPVPLESAKSFVIENEKLKVTLTDRGGAIREIRLKKEFADVTKQGVVVFNARNDESALALAVKNPLTGKLETILSEFAVQPGASADKITFVGGLADGTRIERSFTLATKDGAEPYSLGFATKVIPAAGKPAATVWVSTGCWQPTEGDSANQFLSVLAYDGEDLTRVGLDVFTDSSGFFGLGAHKAQADHAVASVAKPFLWIASGNQFFSSIIHPADASARGARTEVLVLPVGFEGGKRGLQAFASWEPVPAADLSRTFAGEFFVGPKEYARVAALPDGQVAVLQFSKLLGFISFGAVCKLLLAVLGGVHWLLEWSGAWSWGWAIVLLTCLIKVITWPLTSIQMKAAKKMQKFAKPMQDIREKHKDNPEKMQKELMKLYTENKINPFAGCLPILIQMPIFFGLYTSFQTTVELRLHSFLWIADLSAPDTIFELGGFPVNLLPVLMGVTMWLSMRMSPQPSGDGSQKTIFLMMTLLFPVICYPMASALTLYMTIQNLLTMLQTWLTKDEPDVVVIPPATKKVKG